MRRAYPSDGSFRPRSASQSGASRHPVERLLLLLILIVGAVSVFLIDYYNVAFVAFALLYYISGRRQSDLFNPFFLFLPAVLSILLYAPAVSAFYLPPLSLQHKMAVFFGFGAFYIGLASARSSPSPTFVTHKNWVTPNLWVTLAIGILPYGVSVMLHGIPLFAVGDVNVAKEEFQLPVVGMLFVFLPLSVVLSARYRRHFWWVSVLALGIGMIRVAKLDTTDCILLCDCAGAPLLHPFPQLAGNLGGRFGYCIAFASLV